MPVADTCFASATSGTFEGCAHRSAAESPCRSGHDSYFGIRQEAARGETRGGKQFSRPSRLLVLARSTHPRVSGGLGGLGESVSAFPCNSSSPQIRTTENQ